MKVLLVHNRYQEPGGEYVSMLAEEGVLRAAGHRVVEYIRHNDEIKHYGLGSMATLPLRTVWARDSYRQIKALLARERPDVAHFHNTFPLISPAAYYACREAGVPVVQTLHNYRLLCPAATFRRDGRVCEDCLGRNPWRGVLHACYRDSRAATAATALMLSVHRWLGTWSKMVDCYIALTEFARAKFIEGGLSAERMIVKPNFVHPDPKPKDEPGSYALYVGRLSEEKGLRVLLAAWGKVRTRLPLRIAGDGPMRKEMAAEIEAKGLQSVELLGHVSPSEVVTLMHGARFLVFPSQWYEGFPRTIAEAFACGLPAVASRLGGMAEIIADGENGLHFTPGDGAELAERVDWAWTHPEEVAAMGRAARAEYEAKYTADRNYQMLMDIYRRVIKHAA